MSALNNYRKEKQKMITEPLKLLNDRRKNKDHWQKVFIFFCTNVVMGAYDYIQDFIQADEHLT